MRFLLGDVQKKALSKKERLRKAFTVFEAAATTAIVGTVAVLTIGGISNAIQTKALRVHDVMLNNDMSIALAKMEAKGKLSGFSSQEEFLKELKNNFDVKEVLTTPEEVEKNFGKSYKLSDDVQINPNNYAIKFKTSKGESVAITYNTDYKALKKYAYNATGSAAANATTLAARNQAMTAISGMYDVNGASGPNTFGKDAGMFTSLKSNCNNINYISTGNDSRCEHDYEPPVIVCDCAKDPEQEKCKDPINQSEIEDYCELNRTDKNCICLKNPNNPVCHNACDAIDCSLSENKTNQCCYDPSTVPCEDVCVLTEGECDSQHLDFDEKECKCYCGLPKKDNFEIDPAECKYVCTKDLSKFNPNYTDKVKSEAACACVPKDPDAVDKCKKGGGKWNPDTCSCDCSDKKIQQCKADSCGYAEANLSDNFCACECVESNYNSLIEKNAKDIDGQSSAKAKLSAKYTKFDANSPNNKCFSCRSDKATEGGKEFAIAQASCSCVTSCANKPADISKYPYFKYNDMGSDVPDDQLCSWSCDVDKLNELVAQLNKVKANDDLRPFAMDKFKKSTDTYQAMDDRIKLVSFQNTDELLNYQSFRTATSQNMGQAQAWYFISAILGKLRNDGAADDPNFIGINSCDVNHCQGVYKTVFLDNNGAVKNNYGRDTIGRFYRFLIYFNDVEKDPVFGHFDGFILENGTKANGIFFNPNYGLGSRESFNPNGKSLANLFMLKYVADTNACAVKLEDFNYGKEPTETIAFHYANARNNGTNAARHWFTFEYVKNNFDSDSNHSFKTTDIERYKVKNPNIQTVSGLPNDLPTKIVRPDGFKGNDIVAKYPSIYTDWSNAKVGVVILHRITYDPLALNITNDISKAKNLPTFNERAGKVSANLHYNGKGYSPVKVYWPDANYQFLVKKAYASNQHVGNMFSDVMQLNGKVYTTGFHQLKAEMDSNGDGLINGSELNNLGLIARPNDTTIIPITNKVFEINTKYSTSTTASGRSAQNKVAIYEHTSEFRSLAPVSDLDTLCSSNTCLYYVDRKDDGAEIWKSSSSNGENVTTYYMYPLGKGIKNAAYNYKWYDVNGAPVTFGGALIMLHENGGNYYREFRAAVTDIIFRS